MAHLRAKYSSWSPDTKGVKQIVWFIVYTGKDADRFGPHPRAHEDDQALFKKDPQEWAHSILKRNELPCNARFAFLNGPLGPSIKVVFSGKTTEGEDYQLRRKILNTLREFIFVYHK